jgi:hypothetical protein
LVGGDDDHRIPSVEQYGNQIFRNSSAAAKEISDKTFGEFIKADISALSMLLAVPEASVWKLGPENFGDRLSIA